MRWHRRRADLELVARVRREFDEFPAGRPDLGPSASALRDAVESRSLALAGALMERHFIAADLLAAASERLDGPRRGRAEQVEALLLASRQVRGAWRQTRPPT